MKKALSILVILSMVLGLSAFQCASTELTSAKLYIQQKNLDKAKEALEKEVEKNPKSDEGYYLLGYINGEQSDYESMIENFNKSISISNKFEKSINDSKKFHWQDNFNKGVGFFNKGTKVDDEDSSITFFNKSIERFENCIVVEPDTVGSYQNMFYAMINAKRTNSELEVPLLKIIELIKSPEAYVDLSKVYNNDALVLMNSFYDTKNVSDSVKAMEIYNKEIKLLEEAQELYPENSKILAQLSNAYVDADKMDVAMATFQKGIKSDPTNEVYRYNYGVLLLGANQFEEATAQFQKAIELKEDYTSAYYNLGVTYLKWGAALQEQAISEDSDDMTYKEKFSLSVAPLKRYLDENPEDAKIWNFLGKVYANLGDNDKSQEAFDKADLYR
jgi:tetratricopeptide (TPR) repeat protein